MINIENVSFHYSPDRWIISDLNLKILPLTWNIIAGPDGSGKTTLAKLIKGILKPQIGNIIFTPANEINHGGIAYIAGGYSNSVVGVTVLDDICFGMENLCVSQKEMRKRVRNVLAWTGLEGFED
ncbi:MAG: energy-coupling factor ABC transporter ATP-binding protein, partial [Desulfomonilaceae bacterium]